MFREKATAGGASIPIIFIGAAPIASAFPKYLHSAAIAGQHSTLAVREFHAARRPLHRHDHVHAYAMRV